VESQWLNTQFHSSGCRIWDPQFLIECLKSRSQAHGESTVKQRCALEDVCVKMFEAPGLRKGHCRRDASRAGRIFRDLAVAVDVIGTLLVCGGDGGGAAAAPCMPSAFRCVRCGPATPSRATLHTGEVGLTHSACFGTCTQKQPHDSVLEGGGFARLGWN
jgi:hypothetical protein